MKREWPAQLEGTVECCREWPVVFGYPIRRCGLCYALPVFKHWGWPNG